VQVLICSKKIMRTGKQFKDAVKELIYERAYEIHYFAQMPTIGGMRGQLVQRTRVIIHLGIVVLLSLISILVVYSATVHWRIRCIKEYKCVPV